ncbi:MULTISPECIES: alpha/beta hydrolase [unclassified Streptomyces]|uniref:alpha/beta hydrolase n=1 Tax=unclassified Streptomyces TaxID=2593676 RepID=UPI0033C10D41
MRLVAYAALVAVFLVLDAYPSVAAERSEATDSYGSRARQELDVYRNTSNSSQPRIAILHGGYWYENSGWATWSRYFADQGCAVSSIDYRLNFDAAWPTPRTDAISAIDWIRGNVPQFNLDPDRLVVLGSSAGGRIATSLATYGVGGGRVSEGVALSPVASPYQACNDGNHDTSTAEQRKVRDSATVLARCFPDSTDTGTSLHAAYGTAMYLIHSEGDFVPMQHSLDLEEAEEVGHCMPADGVTDETVAGSRAHGDALLDIPGMPDKILAWIEADL